MQNYTHFHVRSEINKISLMAENVEYFCNVKNFTINLRKPMSYFSCTRILILDFVKLVLNCSKTCLLFTSQA